MTKDSRNVFANTTSQSAAHSVAGKDNQAAENSLSLRLLKKVRMQGGATHPLDGYPGAE